MIVFVLFMLPQAFPVTIQTFNYTPVVFLVVLGGASIWYFVSAKHWFKGPKIQGTPEELAAIERDLEVICGSSLIEPATARSVEHRRPGGEDEIERRTAGEGRRLRARPRPPAG